MPHQSLRHLGAAQPRIGAIQLSSTRLIVSIFAVVITLLTLAIILPAFHLSTHAAESTTEVTVAVRPVLSVALTNEALSLDLVQSPDGTFGATSTSLSVSTNAADGYSIYLYTADGSPSLNPASATTSTVISPVADNATPSSFGANTWGYSLNPTSVSADPNSANYHPVSTAADTVAQSTSAPSTGDTYDLFFGANVTNDLTPDSYSNTVVVSVVANPATVSNLTELSFMQDMSPAVCQSSSVGDTTQLIDTRDGKSYWVAKLADGNCWMLQNLDLDLDPSQPLTPADSDVSNIWTPTSATSTTIFNSSDETATLSYDPGLYIKSNPTSFNQYCTTSSSLADPNCVSSGFVDVSSRTAATTATSDLLTDQTYDAHYLVGNYYQWNAATAGTGTSTTTPTAADDTNATDSICPRGWQLPLAGPNENSLSGSFYQLLNQYGFSSNSNSGAIASSPLYLQYSGYIYNGQLYQAGYAGRYWSSTVSPTNHITYALYFSNSVSTTDYYFYFNGLTVRCLAQS